MRYLAACLYCKDENRYLAEWLDYHQAVGVEHVILIDNNSITPLSETVEDWISRGFVTVLHDSDRAIGRQCRAYTRCLREFARDYHWIAFIDTDEFLVPKSAPSLPELLADYESFGGLGVFWCCFGSNGYRTAQPSQIAAYTRRSRNSYRLNTFMKTICNTRFTLPIDGADPHKFRYSPGAFAVDEHRNRLDQARATQHTSELVQLNHYWLRSAQEWQEKLRRGGGFSRPDFHHHMDFKREDRECNLVLDTTIQRVWWERKVSFGR